MSKANKMMNYKDELATEQESMNMVEYRQEYKGNFVPQVEIQQPSVEELIKQAAEVSARLQELKNALKETIAAAETDAEEVEKAISSIKMLRLQRLS